MSFLWFIIIGCTAGFLAGKFTGGSGFGLVLNLIIGVVGGISEACFSMSSVSTPPA